MHPKIASAVFLVFAYPAIALAAGETFPRGPGLYFSILKLFAVVAVYFSWVNTCAWVNEDTRKLRLARESWNAIIVGCGIAGLVAAWASPWFFVSFPVLLLFYLTPSLIYVAQRNELVPPAQKVLTVRHLKSLANHYLRLGLSTDDDGPDGAPIPIRFIGKSADAAEEDNNRVVQAERSRGWRAAQEMVYEAITNRVTDIHMEPSKNEMSVRFRIDGILSPSAPFSRHMGDAVLNIFKVLAALDITEKRKPQDGSFGAEVYGDRPRKKAAKNDPEDADGARVPETDDRGGGRQVDFRVATAGSVAGEKLVMRILDKTRSVSSLTQVGMREKMRDQIRALVTQPHGMFIVCGPTGAGKSTTLYACLSEIDRYQKNVITIENPVEYQIDNVTQIEVNPKAGKTFAGELRSILRQDPDVIYIGEIRDNETAEIACQAAQTGHMVFTTLHANDTVTAIGRLLDLGVQPFMIANAVSAVLGQRLVRVLCPKCKQKYKPNPEIIRKANLPADKIKHFCRPPAEAEDGEEKEKCPRCGGTGYRGRTGVFELLVLTDKIRELIRENPNLNAIRQEAVKSGMKHLQEDGLRQVIECETSIQELMRVCK